MSVSQRYDQRLERLNLHRLDRVGDGFVHAIYMNAALRQRTSSVLHVYLEGDGRPWTRRQIVNDDPTPRTPVVPALMAQDPWPSVLVGRPCYHGFATTPLCNSSLWTSARYSEAVVSSMAQVIGNLTDTYAIDSLVVVGHSGGGTLAMLLAERLALTKAVVTIAGNLDHAMWTRLHGYSPLQGSLNPYRVVRLPASIAQLHLAGALDTNVPPALIQEALAHDSQAQMVIVDNMRHSCCWDQVWSAVLNVMHQCEGDSQSGKQLLEVSGSPCLYKHGD